MLSLKSADQNPIASRRLADTIHWLEQFGELPLDATKPDALARIAETLCQNPLASRDN